MRTAERQARLDRDAQEVEQVGQLLGHRTPAPARAPREQEVGGEEPGGGSARAASSGRRPGSAAATGAPPTSGDERPAALDRHDVGDAEVERAAGRLDAVGEARGRGGRADAGADALERRAPRGRRRASRAVAGRAPARPRSPWRASTTPPAAANAAQEGEDGRSGSARHPRQPVDRGERDELAQHRAAHEPGGERRRGPARRCSPGCASSASPAAPAGSAITSRPVKRAWAVADRASASSRVASSSDCAQPRSSLARSPPASRVSRIAATIVSQAGLGGAAAQALERDLGRARRARARRRRAQLGPRGAGRAPRAAWPIAPRMAWPPASASDSARAASGAPRGELGQVARRRGRAAAREQRRRSGRGEQHAAERPEQQPPAGEQRRRRRAAQAAAAPAAVGSRPSCRARRSGASDAGDGSGDLGPLERDERLPPAEHGARAAAAGRRGSAGTRSRRRPSRAARPSLSAARQHGRPSRSA